MQYDSINNPWQKGLLTCSWQQTSHWHTVKHSWRDIATLKIGADAKQIHGKNNKRNFVSIWHAPQCAANHVVLAQGQIKHSPDLLPSACTVLPSVSHLHNPNEYGRLVVFHTPKSSATCTVSFAYCGCSCALIPGQLPCRAKKFYQHRCF